MGEAWKGPGMEKAPPGPFCAIFVDGLVGSKACILWGIVVWFFKWIGRETELFLFHGFFFERSRNKTVFINLQ